MRRTRPASFGSQVPHASLLLPRWMLCWVPMGYWTFWRWFSRIVLHVRMVDILSRCQPVAFHRSMLKATSGRYFKGPIAHSQVAGGGVNWAENDWTRICKIKEVHGVTLGDFAATIVQDWLDNPWVWWQMVVWYIPGSDLCRIPRVRGDAPIHLCSATIFWNALESRRRLQCLMALVRLPCNSCPRSILSLALEHWTIVDLLGDGRCKTHRSDSIAWVPLSQATSDKEVPEAPTLR